MRPDRNVRGFIGFLLAIAVLTSTLLIANRGSNAYPAAARLELRRQINLANQEHIPLTSGELLAKPIPDSQNAAPPYTSAGEKLDAELRALRRPSASPQPGTPAETYGAAPYDLPRRGQQSELHRFTLQRIGVSAVPGCRSGSWGFELQ